MRYVASWLRRWRPAAGACALLGLSCTGAGAAADLPSCYAANQMEVAPEAAKVQLWVLIDETTPMSARLRQALWHSIEPLVVPGTAYAVYGFSAYSQQRYLTLAARGTVEQPPPAAVRRSISVRKLKTFDECLRDQAGFAVRQVQQAVLDTVERASAQLARSDVMASLKSVSLAVKASKAPERTVLVVSDMLENSSVSSFYQKQGVRLIAPQAELAKAEKEGLLGDFAGARVHVFGAGLVSEDAARAGGIYRDPRTMQALERFWTEYFEKSGATLVEFGKPELINPLR